MSARNDIIAGKFKTTPAGAAAGQAADWGGATAELFASFVGYAYANWNYAAQPGAQTAKALLDGDGPKTIACGTIREALKLMLREDLALTDVANADINRYFLTKPGLQCFDTKVKGNVGNHGKPSFDLACHFSTHYFLQTGGKFFDPCLMAVYANAQGPIGHCTNSVGGTQGLRKAGTGNALVLLHLLPGRTVPGFGSVWEILLPAECKTVLTSPELQALKNDPDVKAAKLL